MQKYTADLIFTKDQKFECDKVIVTNDDGTILTVDAVSDHDTASVKKLEGALIPGFINTHCHLELSHMKNLVDTGTTLLPFLKSVVKHRDFKDEIIQSAIEAGDKEMFENGIVAVGDISNKTDTAFCKSKSKLVYYTFIEMFDFLSPAMTEATIAQYLAVMQGMNSDSLNKKSYAPHAPYTVSKGLFQFIQDNNPAHSTVSIHNQETAHEDELFRSGSGGFVDFFQSFGIDTSHLQATGQSSIHYAMENIDPRQKVLFVHNTMTDEDDIKAAQAWSEKVYWATCPNANLYIENRLPDYSKFLRHESKMTIGTDSLTSNWQLSIWEEIKTIHKYCSYVPIENLITWATINGAKALGYDHIFGSFEVGKRPGLVNVPLMQIGNDWIILEGRVERVL